ncbi:alpha/beta hydrolase family protein [Novosphingobium resinovorum]|uniref:alpha/beta hydrolase family protein n=1 Tax=Novosphingobium resinovorum TaxID=158500 RepID=UPI002ED65221|nr:CocE/NonD family hydrolase [Novosphingobium resinovorum]
MPSRLSRRIAAPLLAFGLGSAMTPASAAPDSPPAPVVSTDPVIVTSTQGRLALRVTAPANGTQLPVLVMAHGAALNRSDYRPLVEAIARAGYIVVQPDFPDASADGIAPKGWPDDTWRVRYDTVAWIGTHLPAVLKPIPGLAHRADLTRTAIAGHSFGGHTAALAMGAKVKGMVAQAPLPYRAALLLSAPGNWEGMTPAWQARAAYLKVDWSGMHGPVLMVNGTADTGPMSDLGAVWHDDGFRLSQPGHDTCLMRVEGAGHYLGGIDSALRPPTGDTTAERRAAVLRDSIAFLDHALDRKTEAAAAWPALRSALTCK